MDALCSEADKYQQSRDYERAERCFRKALAMNPGHTRSLCNYAYMLHVGRRDYAKAEELYRRALQTETEPHRDAVQLRVSAALGQAAQRGETDLSPRTRHQPRPSLGA